MIREIIRFGLWCLIHVSHFVALSSKLFERPAWWILMLMDHIRNRADANLELGNMFMVKSCIVAFHALRPFRKGLFLVAEGLLRLSYWIDGEEYDAA